MPYEIVIKCPILSEANFIDVALAYGVAPEQAEVLWQQTMKDLYATQSANIAKTACDMLEIQNGKLNYNSLQWQQIIADNTTVEINEVE